MKRRKALQILAAGPCILAARPARTEVRICRTLEEAVPADGAAVLLVFFSTGCPLCYDGLFEARHAVERAGWPVAVTGVFAGPEDELRSFLEKYAWTRPVVLDRRKTLFKKYHVEAVPYMVLLLAGVTAYRDDPGADYESRMEALKKCLEKTFSR